MPIGSPSLAILVEENLSIFILLRSRGQYPVFLVRAKRIITALISCESTVARAAPPIPRLKIPIKIRSKITFNIEETIRA